MSAQRAEDPDFENLMERGRIALQKGYPEQAHALWRRAAIVNPYNEQVWLALLDVIQSPEDQRVCLQNILEINPANVKARRMLRVKETQEMRRVQEKDIGVKEQKGFRRSQRSLVWRALMFGIIIGLAGVFFAVALSILIYGL